MKYKKEVLAWFKENKYSAVDSAETIWILFDGPNVLVHGLFADDFLHQTNNTASQETCLSIWEIELSLTLAS